ncbi:MAG: tripartite tricarboxylate transporter TctB family protein [Christensenellales bacterium]
MFELILNVLLLLGLGYAMGFHVLEAAIPLKVQKNPYAMQPNMWPQVILALVIICVVINIINIIRKNKGKPEFSLSALLAGIPAFLKGKLFLGIAIVVAASFILEPLGFMVTSFLFLIAYGLLLGDRKYLRLVLVSLVITVFLYVVFGVLLQVNLPRGTVPFLRDFALFVERLLP